MSMKYSGALTLLWLDLETTGSDESLDEIIEIGCVLTDFELNRISDTFARVVEPGPLALGRLMMHSVVRRMHQDNGLLEEILNNNTSTCKQAERDLINWMHRAVNAKRHRGSISPISKFRFQLAGSGVGHFDRRFINKYLPDLAKLLVYNPTDIGNIRRLAGFAGFSFDPSVVAPQKAKNHRALSDVEMHLAEAQAYFDMFRLLSGNDPIGLSRLADTFRATWNEADARGEKGQRVDAGLRAIFNALGGR